MGQVLHGSVTTTKAVRRAIQVSQESVRALARRHGISPTTVQKWRKRQTVADARMGPKQPRSTVLSIEEEAMIVAFRRHTLLPLDDCLYALQPTIPHLTRSSLHRCLQRHGIARLPDTDGDKPKRSRFKAYPIGFFPIDIAEVHTEQGRLYLFVAIERMNRTIKDATVRRYHYDTHDQLRAPLQLVVDAYNYARRLKTLRGLTPYEFVCKTWTEQPHRFRVDPTHLTPGPNI